MATTIKKFLVQKQYDRNIEGYFQALHHFEEDTERKTYLELKRDWVHRDSNELVLMSRGEYFGVIGRFNTAENFEIQSMLDTAKECNLRVKLKLNEKKYKDKKQCELTITMS